MKWDRNNFSEDITIQCVNIIMLLRPKLTTPVYIVLKIQIWILKGEKRPRQEMSTNKKIQLFKKESIFGIGAIWHEKQMVENSWELV